MKSDAPTINLSASKVLNSSKNRKVSNPVIKDATKILAEDLKSIGWHHNALRL